MDILFCIFKCILGYGVLAESECNTYCEADGTKMCGGAHRNSVYRLTVPSVAYNYHSEYSQAS